MSRYVVIGCVVIVCVVAVVVGYVLCEHLEGVQDAYALDWASAMVASYIDRHHGQAPDTWDDLRPEFDVLSERDKSWTFDEIKGRVVIDFANLEGWTKGRRHNPEFVSTVSGRQLRWSAPDPNERIAEVCVRTAGTSSDH